MDAFTDPKVEVIVWVACSQIGKTETFINNVIGYYIQHDPSPIMVVQPNYDMAKAWSQNRFDLMLQDTPVLRGLVKEPRTKGAKNTVKNKVFPDGQLIISSSKSPSSLSMYPIRILLFDEVGRYDASARSEGDPIALGKKRTTTYFDRKIGMTSSPTIKNRCRITQEYELTDQRQFQVPCPMCNQRQELRFGGKDKEYGLKWESGKPHTVFYLCIHCQGKIYQYDKQRMLTLGDWVATQPFNGRAGFRINELYSPWVSWQELIENFLIAKKTSGNTKGFC